MRSAPPVFLIDASAFDVTTALAGHLGVTATGAHAALLGIIYLTYSAMPFAIATAANIRRGRRGQGRGGPVACQAAGHHLPHLLGLAFCNCLLAANIRRGRRGEGRREGGCGVCSQVPTVAVRVLAVSATAVVVDRSR